MRWRIFAGLAVAVGSLIGRRATDTARAARPDLVPARSWAPAGMVVALIAAMALVAIGPLTPAPSVRCGMDARVCCC